MLMAFMDLYNEGTERQFIRAHTVDVKESLSGVRNYYLDFAMGTLYSTVCGHRMQINMRKVVTICIKIKSGSQLKARIMVGSLLTHANKGQRPNTG